MCSEICDQILSCGHPCKRKCGDVCGGCDVMVTSPKQLECGHPRMIVCGETRAITKTTKCNQKCGKILGCGHICNLTCGSDCLHGKLHGPCKEPCKRKLICGHDCNGKYYSSRPKTSNTYHHIYTNILICPKNSHIFMVCAYFAY